MTELKRTLFCFILMLLQQPLFAWHEPVFNTLETVHFGINKSAYMEWDSLGRLFIITDKGLMRYDGYTPVFFGSEENNVNSPLSTETRSLMKVNESEFWLSYHDQNNYSYFNPISGKFQHIFVDTISNPGFPSVMSTKIFAENDSIRWILTWGQGIIRYNISSKTWKQFKNDDEKIDIGEPPINRIKDMIKWDKDRYLVSFFLELPTCIPHYFYPETGRFEPFELNSFFEDPDNDPLAKIISKATTMVHFLHRDENDQLWVGSYIGLICFDLKNKTVERVTGSHNDHYRQNLENTRNLAIDDNGLYWISTSNQGIMVVDPITKSVHYLKHSMNNDNTIADDRVTSTAKDQFGNMWVSTSSGNLSICFNLVQNFIVHEWIPMGLDFSNRSLQEIPVNQILVKPDGKIFISNANGLIEYDAPNEQFTNFRIIKELLKNTGSWDRGIEFFRFYNDKLIYRLSMADGHHYIVYFDTVTKKTVKIARCFGSDFVPLFRHRIDASPLVAAIGSSEGSIQSIKSDYSGLDTLFILPNKERISEYFSLLLEDSSWFFPVAKTQLGRYFPEEKRFIKYYSDSTEYIYPDSSVLCAIEGKDGSIWVGSQTGLYKQEKNSTVFKKSNELAGLKDKECVNSIYEDTTGNFWIATTRELIHWDTKLKSYTRYNQSHGLNVGNFLPAVWQSDTLGNIYIATYHGILQFNPYQLKMPDHQLNIYISNAFLNEQKIEDPNFFSADRILEPNENYFTFELHTNEAHTLTPTTFFYKLSGRDSNWTNNGTSNKIRLEDISHGQYTLQIKAINTYNSESEILSIPLNIDKPFYLKWWFITLILVVVVLFIWWYIQVREKVLREKSIMLERTVAARTAEVVKEKKEAEKQKLAAEHQKDLVEEKQKEITDSINYARRIQNAILPSQKYFLSQLPDSFILYIPKDVVAGDFYFMEHTTDQIFIAVADCTGHGVPGAMVSVVCHNALSRAVKEFGITNSDEILNKTRELVLETFAKSEDQVNDGMDISLCCINRKNLTMEFSGANNGLYLIRKGELIEFKPDKQPVGKFMNAKPFTTQKIKLESGDQYYLFSDGYADQFGGEAGKPGGKKFKYSRLKNILLEKHMLHSNQQKESLVKIFNDWRGDFEQVDDICIVGFKID